MKRIWIALAITVLVLTACGPEPEPTMNPADVQGTAMAAALTMVAATQAAMPTATAIPPTEAPTSTPFPTNTVPPLSLASPTSSVPLTSSAQTGAVLPTSTSASVSGSGDDPCNKPLSAWEGESASLTITNKTKPKGSMTISLYVVTPLGECGYMSATFQNGGKMTIPLGNYSAWAIVNSKKSFTAGTSFVITRSANYQLIVEQERVLFTAGCTPDC